MSFDQKGLPVPSPTRRGLGRGSSYLLTPAPNKKGLGKSYLYLLQKSITTKSSGFTIIECLLAIIMVSIMLTAVAPVIVLSVATRVQARRVEQATMAARTYVDGIQTGTIPAPANFVVLNEVNPVTKVFTPNRQPFADTAPPPASTTIAASCSSALRDPNNPYCTNDATLSLYCVDNGGGCVGANTKDFVVQAFRSAVDATDDGSKGYLLGVRVYRADLFDGATTFTTKKVGTNTGGTGKVLGGSNGLLMELSTEVRPGVKLLTPATVTPVPGVSPSPSPKPGDAMNDLCTRLGGC